MSRNRRRNAMRQSFSFHRLRSPAVAAGIVAATGLTPSARVFEFGAGGGVLTCSLAARVERVTAIEIARELYGVLVQSVACHPNVDTLHADFRDVRLPPRGDYSVVANLPYSLTAETMRHLLERASPPDGAFLIVQREAAASWTGTGRTALRAVLAWPRFSFEVPLALRRRDFDPWPRVESVLLAVRRRPLPLLTGREARNYEEFAARGFTGGATVARNLRGMVSGRRLRAALTSLDIEGDGGPASMSPGQWLSLWRKLQR